MLPFTSTFAFARLLGGIVTGLGSTASAMYSKLQKDIEVCPKKVAGAYGCSLQILLTFGIFIAYCLCIPLPVFDFESPWNYWVYSLFIIPAGFALLQLALFHFYFIYDTPKWLVDNGRSPEALAFLETIYHKQEADRELRKLEGSDVEMQDNQSVNSEDLILPKGSKEITYSSLLKSPNLGPLIIGCCKISSALAILSQGSGINVIIFYSTEIMLKAGGASRVHYMTALVGLANMLPTLLCSLLIESNLKSETGRKALMLVGFIGMAICNFIIGYSSEMGANPWVVVAFILVFLIFFEFSIGTIFWVYCSETMIDKSVGIAVAVNWTAATFVVGTLLELISQIGLAGTFYFYGSISAFSIFFILIFVPESKNHKLQL